MTLPEYLDVDEFFRGAPTCSVGRDVAREVQEERNKEIIDPYIIRYNQDFSDLASRVVGAEGHL